MSQIRSFLPQRRPTEARPKRTFEASLVPGHSIARELELEVKGGFTPMEALQAATIVAARVMGLDGESGTVEPGKRADLVLLEGDPLADIRAVRRVHAVVTEGRMYLPAPLWRSVGFAP